MSRFQFINNTPARFIRMEDYSNPQTENNRLYKDYYYQGRLVLPYFVEYDINDSFFFQYETDYDSANITIVKDDGSILTGYETKTLIKIYDDPTSEKYGLKQYNVDIAITSLSGKYCIKINCEDYAKPILNFQSESFNVCVSTLIKLEWYGSTVLNDPFIWTKNASIRLNSEIRQISGGEEVNTYDASDETRL